MHWGEMPVPQLNEQENKWRHLLERNTKKLFSHLVGPRPPIWHWLEQQALLGHWLVALAGVVPSALSSNILPRWKPLNGFDQRAMVSDCAESPLRGKLTLRIWNALCFGGHGWYRSFTHTTKLEQFNPFKKLAELPIGPGHCYMLTPHNHREKSA
jgi:hypothetical protein